jgi:hypothetical protein
LSADYLHGFLGYYHERRDENRKSSGFALHHNTPWRQSRSPQIIETRNSIAVSVDQHGDQIRILDPLSR